MEWLCNLVDAASRPVGKSRVPIDIYNLSYYILVRLLADEGSC